MAKFNLNFLQNILRTFIPLNTNMYMYSRIKDYHLKNEKFTYNFSLPKTSNNTLRKSAVSFCCVHFVSTSIDLM